MARDFIFSEHGAISDSTANTITAFSLVGWFKWDGNQHSTTLISGTNAAGPTVTWSHALRMTGADLFQAYAFDGSVRSINGTTTAVIGQYYHVAMTAVNGGAMKLYVNGALEATSGFTLGTLTTVLDRWRLGGGTSGTLFWSGDIAEVALFRSVLSAGDIASLASGASSPLDVGAPRWYFPLCGTGTETDLSANGLTLTWPVTTPGAATHPVGIANGCGFAVPKIGSFAFGADMDVQATRAISFNVDSASYVDTAPNTFTVHGAVVLDGDVEITGALTGGGSGAPVGASYLTLGTDGTLTSERVLTAGSGISFTDGGAGSTLTIAASGGGGSGAVVQSVTTQTGATATTTATIPLDDTIPQISEGAEFMTRAITPTSSSNRLRIDVVFWGTVDGASWNVVALFQDATANALAASAGYQTVSTGANPVSFTHSMVSGTTSPTTFRVRAGRDGSGGTTLRFNGYGGSRLLGGVMASSITVTEIVP